MKKICKKTVVFLLGILILFTLPISASMAQPLKDEVVYVKLHHDGTQINTYVINSFQVDAAGTFTDYGSYETIINLTTTDMLTSEDGAINIGSPKGTFYYQGNLEDAEIPWLITISYLLDGTVISPDDLAGQSGELQIMIDIEANPDANAVFDQNYSLQTSLTLNTQVCSNIAAINATISDSGKDKLLTFIKMPNDTAHYVITTYVENFEMDGIQFGAVPFSMSIDLPDTNDLADEISSLQDAIEQINTAAGSMADGTDQLDSGMSQFNSGLSDMYSGLDRLTKGLGDLTGGNADLEDASAQILYALTTIKDNLDSAGAIDLSELDALTDGSSQILSAVNGLSGGLSQVQSALSNVDTFKDGNNEIIAYLQDRKNQLDDSIPKQAEEIEKINGMIQTLTQESSLLSGLDVSINGDGTEANPGLASIASTLASQYAIFDTNIQDLPDSLNELAGGILSLKDAIDQLASNYGTFNSGLGEYLSGASTLYDGFNGLYDGFSDILDASSLLSSSLTDLSDGMQQLADGTDEMYSQTKDMDTQLQDKIDELLSDYDTDDFVPVSFVSEKNTNVELVQFVMMTDEIKSVNAQNTPETQSTEQSFWQRLLALFGL
jgi:X-X-X-Leu-X-X-Gly heptad repeat protein